MIATVQNKPIPVWHGLFLKLLPAVNQQARFASRGMQQEARQEFIAQVVANVTVAVARLAEQGKLNVARATPLAQYAIRQVRQGRLTGGKMNRRDVSSHYCRQMNGIQVERLDRVNSKTGEWKEALVEDRRAGPAETAAARIDFARFLGMLSGRDRRIAEELALSHRTEVVAHRFGLSPSRISQMRRELHMAWQRFHGELPAQPVRVRAA